jgi:hypothetical protein
MTGAGHSCALAALAAAAVVVACGSNSGQGASGTSSRDGGSGGSDAAGVGDGAADGGTEGSSGATYPAFAVDYPQIDKNNGTVLGSPVIVTVTWPGDSNASTWEAFGDAIGASSYWSATTSEYGVGAATSGPSNHVRMAQPLPSTLSYTDLQNYVIATLGAAESDGGVGTGEAGSSDAGPSEAGASEAGAPNPRWPTPTLGTNGRSQTIYSLFIPSSTAVTDPGTGQSFCVEGGLGYHDDVTAGGVDVAYSVTLECASLTPAALEETAAHEYVEAATNPYPESTAAIGYVGFDANHLAWDLYTGFNDELADACQNWQDAYYQESGSFPYWVQRSWSNAAAKAGHDPCVPSPAGAYHGMTLLPASESGVSVNLTAIGGAKTTTMGFAAALNQPLTFQVGFFSDASAPPWTIAYDFPAQTRLFSTSGTPVGNGKGTVSIDKTDGQNGDQANVTVTVTERGPAGFHVMAITWDPPTQTRTYLPHYLPIVIVDE